MPEYDKAASELWELTKTDWNVRLSNVLTEPVCAYVSLYPDDESFPSLTGYIGTGDANESIRKACEYHLETLRKSLTPDKRETP